MNGKQQIRFANSTPIIAGDEFHKFWTNLYSRNLNNADHSIKFKLKSEIGHADQDEFKVITL